MRKIPRLQKRRWGLLLLVVFLVLVLADYAAYPYGLSSPGTTGNRGENGLWLRYTWYFGKKTTVEREALPARLREQQIRYAYFHVRFIDRDGKLHFRYPR